MRGRVGGASFPSHICGVGSFNTGRKGGNRVLYRRTVGLTVLAYDRANKKAMLIPPKRFLANPVALGDGMGLRLRRNTCLGFSSRGCLCAPAMLAH